MQRAEAVILLMGLLVLSAPSCKKRYVPKPYGYYRIELPEHSYQAVTPNGAAVSFEMSEAAVLDYKVGDMAVSSEAGKGWFDVVYPSLNVAIHCSYKPVSGNLRQLSDDAQEFVFKHAGKASAIPEQGYEDEDNRLYGVYYELRGNTASPCQFYLTDSVSHFFRGSVYFNCIPNQDSLAPVVTYLEEDIKHIMETTRWR